MATERLSFGIGALVAWLALRDRYPDPEPGQVWKSPYNGHSIRVESVEISDTGGMEVHVQRDNGFVPGWGIPDTYVRWYTKAGALRRWQRRLREEKRIRMPDEPITHESYHPPPRDLSRPEGTNPPPTYPRPSAPPAVPQGQIIRHLGGNCWEVLFAPEADVRLGGKIRIVKGG